jgi:dTDP-4-dehydrorhamnose reductase
MGIVTLFSSSALGARETKVILGALCIIARGVCSSPSPITKVADVARASIHLISRKYDNKVILITGRKVNSINEVFGIIKKILKISSKPIFKNIKNNHYSKNPYSYKEMIEEKYTLNNYINLKKGITEVINYEKEII